MADLQDELVGLRAQVAALTARLYRVEQRLGLESESPREAPVVKHEAAKAPYPLAPPPSTPAKPSEPLPTFLAGPLSSSAAVRAEEDELEGQIGKLWLNRIGIVAILVGVSYFIKYAFDNG
ncbi:MAG: hypothetical protein DMG63_08740, partial [Acidobacteria bacterium]